MSEIVKKMGLDRTLVPVKQRSLLPYGRPRAIEGTFSDIVSLQEMMSLLSNADRPLAKAA